MTQKILDNLAFTFAYYFLSNNETGSILIEEIEAIFKIFDIKYVESPSSLHSLSGLTSSCFLEKGKWGPKNVFSNSPIPYPISSFDKECLEDILNDETYISFSGALAPLFACIGWQLVKIEDTYKLYFKPTQLFPSLDNSLDSNYDFTWKKK